MALGLGESSFYRKPFYLIITAVLSALSLSVASTVVIVEPTGLSSETSL